MASLVVSSSIPFPHQPHAAHSSSFVSFNIFFTFLLHSNKILRDSDKFITYLDILLLLFDLVAQVSLIIQNVAVIICGVLLLIMLELEHHIQHPFITLLEAVIIIVGSIADLSSVGTKIAVEKDWVVVIAGSDKSLLASK